MRATGIARRGRTGAAAAAAVVLAALLAGCSSDDKPIGGGLGDTKGGGGGKDDLTSLLLTQADLPPGKGYGIGATTAYPGPSWPATPMTESKAPQCRPLLDMIDLDRATIRPTKVATVEITGAPMKLTSSVLEYDDGQAQQLTANLKAAVPACHDNESKINGGAWTPVTTLDNYLPTVGDGGAGYSLNWGEHDDRIFTTISVIRVDDRLVMITASIDKPNPDANAAPDFALIRAQVKKLTGKD